MGLRVLADLSQIDAEYPQGVLYVPLPLIEKRPDLVRMFLGAYVEGIRQFKNNKPVAFNIIAKSSGLKDRAEIEEYHSLLTKNFLLDYPMPTLLGVKTVLKIWLRRILKCVRSNRKTCSTRGFCATLKKADPPGSVLNKGREYGFI